MKEDQFSLDETTLSVDLSDATQAVKESRFEDALTVLEKYSSDEDAYTHELKGDALSGVGNNDLALQQYQSAFEKYTDSGLRNLVELKINNLNTNE